MTHGEIMFHKERCAGAYGDCALCSLRAALDSLSESRSWIARALKQGATTIGTLKGVSGELKREAELLERCVTTAHEGWLKDWRRREEAKR